MNPVDEILHERDSSYRTMAELLGVSHMYLWKVAKGRFFNVYKLALALEKEGIMKGCEFATKYKKWLSEQSA